MTEHAPSLHLPPADAASITYRSNLAEVRAFVRAHAAVAGTNICLHMQLDL